MGVALKDSLGGAFPNLAHDLRGLDSLGNSLSATLTLLDPNASLRDRSQAVAELFANVPNVKDDLGRLRNDVVDRILGKHTELAFDLSADLADSLDTRVHNALTPEQIFQINTLNDELLVDGTDNAVADLLTKLDDPASVDALLEAVGSQSDTAGKKALVETLGELGPGAADDLLQSTIDGKPGAIALGEVVSKLDDDAQKALGKLIKEFDQSAIDFLVRTGSQVDGAALDEFVKVAGKLPSERVGQALNLIDAVLGRAGVVLDATTASKLLKGVAKLVPALGAVPAAYDAAQLFEISRNDNLPADIRFLASTGAKINGVDAAASVVEAFTAWTGVAVAADVAIGVGALITDLVVTDQIAKFEAAGTNYEAPDWLTTLNVTTAGLQGPAGWVEYWEVYGAEGGAEAIGIAIETGGEAAINATEGLLVHGIENIGNNLEATAEGLHVLADIIRDPSKYGELAQEAGQRAVEKLSELADGAGVLARAARDELQDVVGDLKNLGEDGLEALQWIASNPGEAAQHAVDAIEDIANDALELGTAAGKAVARQALETLNDVADLGDEIAAAANRALTNVAENAIELGEEGIEILGWIANNPGESAQIAKEALVDVAVAGGELAEAAYTEIVDLGEAGVELANEVARSVVDLGEDGIEMLTFIARNPGDAADIAVDGLKNIASEIGDAARQAGEELVRLTDLGVEAAGEALENLLLEGGESIRNVVAALNDEIGPGVAAVINGLADVGDAGLEALAGLADAGFDFAADGFSAAADAISGLGDWAWSNTFGRLGNPFNND